MTEKLNLSAELWGGWDWDPSGTTREASADGAVAYLLSNDLQLDAGANFGLNRRHSGRGALRRAWPLRLLMPLAVSSPV